MPEVGADSIAHRQRGAAAAKGSNPAQRSCPPSGSDQPDHDLAGVRLQDAGRAEVEGEQRHCATGDLPACSGPAEQRAAQQVLVEGTMHITNLDHGERRSLVRADHLGSNGHESKSFRLDRRIFELPDRRQLSDYAWLGVP